MLTPEMILFLFTGKSGMFMATHRQFDEDKDIPVIIGAGPFSLALSAHLKAQKIPSLIIGKPMEFWRKMPTGFYFKSYWRSLSFSDPAGFYSLESFCKKFGITQQGEVPIQIFLNYAEWFQQETRPNIDQTYVKMLSRDGDGYHLELKDGRSVKTSKLVVATGLTSFAHIPDFASHLPSTLASHVGEHSDFSKFKGKDVVVVGSGQSAFEAATMLHEVGASVELIAYGSIVYIQRRLYRYTGPARHLFYAPSDIGPAGISWIVAFPLLYRLLPEKLRIALDTRSIRPAVAKWIRIRTEGHVTITPHTLVVSATEQGEKICLTLSDGTTRLIDHLMLGTGYKPNVQALPFIDPALRQQIRSRNGYPFLNKWFESSVPHLYFTGCLSAYDFGPLCRHVAGSGTAARQITQHILSSKSLSL
jgi:cation diffusion facilitator CzcD-associated flavoprotein CzcO